MEPKFSRFNYELNKSNESYVELEEMHSGSLDLKQRDKKQESLENLIGKVDKVFTFEEIARGGIKIVWIKRSSIPSSDQAESNQYVYYTAISSFFGKKRRELEDEYAKMTDIAKNLNSLGVNTDYLAVDVQLMQKEEWVNGQYTLKVLKATTDFEKKLRNKDTTLSMRIILGSHFLQGLAKLHEAGFAHGDLKPENCLIFEHQEKKAEQNEEKKDSESLGNKQVMLRIGDFGKTKKVKNTEGLSYWGNLRFVCPEGQQSKKGDVYSAALILIRDFEERYLEKTSSLITIEAKNRDFVAAPGFQGIEKYLVENRAFLGCNRGLSVSLVKRHFEVDKLSTQDKEHQSQEIHRYIDALSRRLEDDKDFPKDRVQPFCDLLKKMTLADPKKRISSADAAKIYQNIFDDNKPTS